MKKLLFLFLLMPACLLAQNYTAAVDVPGKDAATLYNKAKEWFAESFSTPGKEPLVEDKANGKLTGKENFTSLIYSNDVAVNLAASYTVKVSVKDGQYKYEFENIMVEHGRKYPLSTFKNGTTREGTIEMFKIAGMKSPSKKMIEANIDYNSKVVKQVDEEINRLIENLGEKMKK